MLKGIIALVIGKIFNNREGKLMEIKAVAFDVGQTLIRYSAPLNWQALYQPAIKQVMQACNLEYNKEADDNAQKILTKYNTRVNFRDYEVSSDTIFTEIFQSWGMILDMHTAKQAFYSYFQNDAACFDDTEYVLQSLKNRGIKIGVLTDVAYGMDNEFALQDLSQILKYMDVCLTSNDVGYRKPNRKGFLLLKEQLGVPSNQIIFVGDEEKDIIGANDAGFVSVLINRTNEARNWGQDYTIHELSTLLDICKKI